jgi:hypothetical protein
MNACTKRSLSWVAVVAVLAGVLWFSAGAGAAPAPANAAAKKPAKQPEHHQQAQQHPEHHHTAPPPVHIHDPLRRIYYREEIDHIRKTEDITRTIISWRWAR